MCENCHIFTFLSPPVKTNLFTVIKVELPHGCYEMSVEMWGKKANSDVIRAIHNYM